MEGTLVFLMVANGILLDGIIPALIVLFYLTVLFSLVQPHAVIHHSALFLTSTFTPVLPKYKFILKAWHFSLHPFNGLTPWRCSTPSESSSSTMHNCVEAAWLLQMIIKVVSLGDTFSVNIYHGF